MDCDGHSLVGPGAGVPSRTGVTLSGRSGVTVRDCTVIGFQNGILVSGGFGNTVADNAAHNNTEGIRLSSATASALR